jgi:Flp pilus assembly protein TadG
MRRTLLALIKSSHGTAAVEMALSIPLLMALLFGAFELGNYFMTEHVVVKAVRDGARYAARQPFTDYTSCSPSSALIDATRNVTRTGQIGSGGTARFASWSDPNSITVTATCDNSGTYTGIYVTSPTGTPAVTVSATVPYTSLLGQLGIANPPVNLNAQSTAAVTGI